MALPPRQIAPVPDTADALATITWALHDQAVREGDLPTALRALRTIADLKGWTAATARRKPKVDGTKEISEELARLEKELEIS